MSARISRVHAEPRAMANAVRAVVPGQREGERGRSFRHELRRGSRGEVLLEEVQENHAEVESPAAAPAARRSHAAGGDADGETGTQINVVG